MRRRWREDRLTKGETKNNTRIAGWEKITLEITASKMRVDNRHYANKPVRALHKGRGVSVANVYRFLPIKLTTFTTKCIHARSSTRIARAALLYQINPPSDHLSAIDDDIEAQDPDEHGQMASLLPLLLLLLLDQPSIAGSPLFARRRTMAPRT